ncbi:hypothetical protein BK133_02910 [Paenibacillus sp. FSL H8-0548]|nr:hypothetical protein BK133_02910 [Paenibacillus sp. FSL H8-0548]
MLIVPYSKYYKHFQADFLKALVADGHELIAVAPDGHDNLFIEGITYKRTLMNNTGTNLFYDLYGLYKLITLLKKERPDIVCCYSLKPNLYGSIAAKVSCVKQVNLFVTGVGYIFTAKTIKSTILYPFIKCLYSFALHHSSKVFFENKDDAELFNRIQPLKDKAVLVNGTGVNLHRFQPGQTTKQTIVFLLTARMLKDKGIVEFVEAAKVIKAKYPETVFQLLGPFDRNPSAIAEDTIRGWENSGYIEYLGETDDVRPYLRQATVFVLPSYREGTPKSVLEAMAMGLPIITTDAPGCRETVIQGMNGFLVPPRDVTSLANAMEPFIYNKGLAKKMGIMSREIAVEKYDVEKVNHRIKEAMGI